MTADELRDWVEGYRCAWTVYSTPPPREYSNLWVVRLAEDGRARELAERWLEHR